MDDTHQDFSTENNTPVFSNVVQSDPPTTPTTPVVLLPSGVNVVKKGSGGPKIKWGKGAKAMLAGSILALILLVGGIIGGTKLSQQPQRPKIHAAGGCCGPWDCGGGQYCAGANCQIESGQVKGGWGYCAGSNDGGPVNRDRSAGDIAQDYINASQGQQDNGQSAVEIVNEAVQTVNNPVAQPQTATNDITRFFGKKDFDVIRITANLSTDPTEDQIRSALNNSASNQILHDALVNTNNVAVKDICDLGLVICAPPPPATANYVYGTPISGGNYGWDGKRFLWSTLGNYCYAVRYVCLNQTQLTNNGCNSTTSSQYQVYNNDNVPLNGEITFSDTACGVQQIDISCGENPISTFASRLTTCQIGAIRTPIEKSYCNGSCGFMGGSCNEGLSCQNEKCWGTVCEGFSAPQATIQDIPSGPTPTPTTPPGGPTPTPTPISAFQCQLIQILRGGNVITPDQILLNDSIVFRGFASATNTTVSSMLFTVTINGVAQTPVSKPATLVGTQYQADYPYIISQATSYSASVVPVSP